MALTGVVAYIQKGGGWMMFSEVNSINIHNEKSLHAGIKQWYFRPGDRTEVRVMGKIIDIVRFDQLIEIQTKNLSAIKSKLTQLLDAHSVRLIFPLAIQSIVITLGKDGRLLRARKSPKKKQLINIFEELIGIAPLIQHKNFSLEIILIKENDIRKDDGKGSWRRKGITLLDRQLKEVLSSITFSSPQDYLQLVGGAHNLQALGEFTNKELAQKLKISLSLATKITYCMRKMELLRVQGKINRAYLYKFINSKEQLSS